MIGIDRGAGLCDIFEDRIVIAINQVRKVGAVADGVIVGTAVVRVVEQNAASADLPAKLEALARELSSGLPSKNP